MTTEELTAELLEILEDAKVVSASPFAVADRMVCHCGRLLAVYGKDCLPSLILAAERAWDSSKYPLRLPTHGDIQLQRVEWVLFRQIERFLNALAENMK